MSTDDLTRRARQWARLLPDAWPETKDLVSELADEVDRLRVTDGVCTHQNAQYLAMKAERDAARAALERVRALVESDGFYHSRNHILNALKETP